MTRVRGPDEQRVRPARAEGLDPATRELVEARSERLGPAYRLFYTDPVHVVRGLGHPALGRRRQRVPRRVQQRRLGRARAPAGGGRGGRADGARSARTRATCTRASSRYAGELLDSLGGEVGAGHAMFTCTGSEANDLALRIAKYRTGRDGVIITDEAYHGNSAQTAEISASLGENSPLGPWVRQVRVPTTSPKTLARPRDVADLRASRQRRRGVHRRLRLQLRRHLHARRRPRRRRRRPCARPAACSSPTRSSAASAASATACGATQRHGVDPDIVTLGKPMGNGFPVAGLAVRREVVADFGHDVRYFNTFGGNTVAIAAAQAVFDVIRDEGLVENSRRGRRRAARRARRAARAPPGDARRDPRQRAVRRRRARRTPAPIVNGLRARRVLISATGRAGNTLKIRPPLVFSSDDVALFLEALDAVLAQPND